MRITYKGRVLADGGRGSPVGLGLAAAKELQTAVYLRADYGRVFDRGNALFTLTWQHSRQFASASQAQHWVWRFADSLEMGEGTLRIQCSAGTVVELSSAVLEVPELVEYSGIRATYRYSATGRALTGSTLPAWSLESGGSAGIRYGGKVLSAGSEASYSSLSIGGSRVTDRSSALRATAARVTDRRNRLNVIRWEQERDFATADEAERYLLLHAGEIPSGSAALTITLDDGTLVTLADAVLQLPDASRIAATRVRHSYEATGRAISADAALPDYIDPNTGTAVPADVVVNGATGEYVTHDGAFVTHS